MISVFIVQLEQAWQVINSHSHHSLNLNLLHATRLTCHNLCLCFASSLQLVSLLHILSVALNELKSILDSQ